MRFVDRIKGEPNIRHFINQKQIKIAAKKPKILENELINHLLSISVRFSISFKNFIGVCLKISILYKKFFKSKAINHILLYFDKIFKSLFNIYIKTASCKIYKFCFRGIIQNKALMTSLKSKNTAKKI